jgi:hypothetical protein
MKPVLPRIQRGSKERIKRDGERRTASPSPLRSPEIAGCRLRKERKSIFDHEADFDDIQQYWL